MLSTDPGTRTAIVFVHGYLGHPMSTWSQFHDATRLCGDATWNTSDLYFLGYDSTGLDVRGASEILLRFLRELLPKPPLGLFESTYQDRRITVRPEISEYHELYLIGHSLGGVVIRNAIRLGLRDKIRRVPPENIGSDAEALFGARTVECYLANAHLRLFAPAIGGSRLSGWLGIAEAFGRPTMAWSRSKAELEQSSAVLTEIRRETERFAAKMTKLRAFTAQIAWAGDDKVVIPLEYEHDDVGKYFPEATHKSICKPSKKFLLPLDFIGLGNGVTPATKEV
ncbi:hypothetical protein DMC63_00360 [Streptomyces sp. WAC 05977]|nr:hypothetical protein DMC63_00360 [Streptomyces sp. WAC 05977]